MTMTKKRNHTSQKKHSFIQYIHTKKHEAKPEVYTINLDGKGNFIESKISYFKKNLNYLITSKKQEDGVILVNENVVSPAQVKKNTKGRRFFKGSDDT